MPQPPVKNDRSQHVKDPTNSYIQERGFNVLNHVSQELTRPGCLSPPPCPNITKHQWNLCFIEHLRLLLNLSITRAYSKLQASLVAQE